MRDILRVLAITVAISSIGFGQEYQRNKYVEGSGIAADVVGNTADALSGVPIIGPAVNAGLGAYEHSDIERQYNEGNISQYHRKKALVKNWVGKTTGVGGSIGGGAVGTALFPGAGTVAGAVGGGFVGKELGEETVEWVFGIIEDNSDIRYRAWFIAKQMRLTPICSVEACNQIIPGCFLFYGKDRIYVFHADKITYKGTDRVVSLANTISSSNNKKKDVREIASYIVDYARCRQLSFCNISSSGPIYITEEYLCRPQR